MIAFLLKTMGYYALTPPNDTKNEPVFLVTLDLDRFFQLVLLPADRGDAEKRAPFSNILVQFSFAIESMSIASIWIIN